MSDTAGLDWMARNVNDFASHFLQRYEKQGSLREGLMYAFNRTFQGVPASPVTAKEAANWPECRAPAEPDPAADPRLVREFKLEAELAASQFDSGYYKELFESRNEAFRDAWYQLEASQERVRELESRVIWKTMSPHLEVPFTAVDARELEHRAEKAEQERDALAKDAERYRWIKSLPLSNVRISVIRGGTEELFCVFANDYRLDDGIDIHNAAISGRDAT